MGNICRGFCSDNFVRIVNNTNDELICGLFENHHNRIIRPKSSFIIEYTQVWIEFTFCDLEARQSYIKKSDKGYKITYTPRSDRAETTIAIDY